MAPTTDAHVMTVLGPVPPDQLGPTLTHEHLYADVDPALGSREIAPGSESRLDWSTAAEARWNPMAFPENNRYVNYDLVVAELAPFRAAGGGTIVDVTPAILGRNPEVLVDISRRAGINVVMGGGYYIDAFHPPGLGERTADDVAQEFIQEIRHGVGETGVRPGIMGEIGTGDPLTPTEATLLRAHAWASLETGIALTIHQQSWGKAGHAILDVLEAEGLPADRIVLGHMTPVIDDIAYQRSLLDRGPFLSYDFLGMDHSNFIFGRVPPDPPGRYPPNDYDVLIVVRDLIRDGYIEQILLSHDIAELIRLRAYGSFGYAHILEHLVPLLRTFGVGEDEVDRVLVRNPARLLTVASDR